MAELIAVSGAITEAVRLSKELSENGCINCRVIHTPAKISSGNCSYSVKLEEKYISLLKKIMENKKIRVKAIYREIKKEGELFYERIS